MFKTPDSPLPHIFTNKARMFEFQFQGEFLQKPSHPIYLSVSFKDPPKIGIMMRTIVGAGLNWVKKVNKGFYYTLGKEGERPRVAFPLIYAVDRLVVSDVGEKGLPKVGQVIEGESEEEVKKRKKGLGDPIVFETDKVYSIALWSAFVDWVKWRVCNIPGVRPFGMESVTSGQPLTFCIYELEGSHGVEEGEMKNVFAEFEISLIGKTNPPAHLPEEDTDSEEENEEDTSLWMSYDTPLKVKSSDSEVTDGGGFACLQSQGGVGYCVLKKPSPNTQTSSNPTSDRVRFGDCVLIRSEGVSQRIKWLSTHRGWWLKWISTMPKHNGHFIVEGGVEGDFVTVGGSWTLRHKRWKGYIVGASQSTNAKYGGRMMGLLKSTTTSTSTTEDDLELEREMAEDDGSGSKKKKPWMEQVKFKAFHAMEEEEEDLELLEDGKWRRCARYGGRTCSSWGRGRTCVHWGGRKCVRWYLLEEGSEILPVEEKEDSDVALFSDGHPRRCKSYGGRVCTRYGHGRKCVSWGSRKCKRWYLIQEGAGPKFSDADLTGDGEVQQEEFASLLSEAPEDVKSKAAELFQAQDEDGSKGLSEA